MCAVGIPLSAVSLHDPIDLFLNGIFIHLYHPYHILCVDDLTPSGSKARVLELKQKKS